MKYNTGTPTKTGVYACVVDDSRDPNGLLTTDKFLIYYNGWSYPGSDQKFRGTVYGWIGPLPRKPILDKVRKNHGSI